MLKKISFLLALFFVFVPCIFSFRSTLPARSFHNHPLYQQSITTTGTDTQSKSPLPQQTLQPPKEPSSTVPIEEVGDETDDDHDFKGFVPTINTANLDISMSNPFGPAVLSVSECRKELLSILRKEIVMDEQQFYHARVEYLTKVLEGTFVPAQTIPFLQLILAGDWYLAYSNVLIPRADPTLEVSVQQEIQPLGMGGDNEAGHGEIRNRIMWKLNRPNDQTFGDFVAECQYQITTKGDLDVTLKEHFLLPNDEIPQDPEDLVMSLQRSVPFEAFDPDQILIKNTYIHPELRICRINGNKFDNVVNIYWKSSVPAKRRGSV